MVATLPKLSNHTGRQSNTHRLTVGNLTVYFSYETPIAFRYGAECRVIENTWGKTTGRHINEAKRDMPTEPTVMESEAFNARLGQLFRAFGK